MIFAAPCFAQSSPLKIDLAEDHIDISTGFNGTGVVLFGVKADPDADIIVTLKGPEHTMALRRKGRVMGAWMNTKTVEFRRVVSYYDYASTLSDTYLSGDLPFLKDYEIGIDHLGFYDEDADEDEEVVASFRDALISSMQKKGLYPLAMHSLRIIDRQFFKASFDLPPGVPTGLYRIEALVVKDNAVIAREFRNLQVGQVGFNARVYLFAQNYSFFYGIFAVVMALAIGASAFTFLRRD
jgi:uncharacterized protein (TIGR02186 family)